MLNAKIVVGGRVTGIRRITDTRRVWVEIHTHERLWIRVLVEFCLTGMDSRTIYLRTTHRIAIPTPDSTPNMACREVESLTLDKLSTRRIQWHTGTPQWIRHAERGERTKSDRGNWTCLVHH
jgi:hypothetical protein